MFLDTSRYARVAQDETTTRDGRRVTAIRLRRLPPTLGDDYAVKDNDRLDLLAQSACGDGTRFWHIADANSRLDAGELTVVTGRNLKLPKT